MKIYSKRRVVFFLLAIVCCMNVELEAQSQKQEQLDCMVDFAYPVTRVESARNDLSEAVYSLQQNDIDLVAHMLQSALAKLVSRKALEDDDRQYIQDMINQINAMIESLESNDKSIEIVDLCNQLQDRV